MVNIINNHTETITESHKHEILIPGTSPKNIAIIPIQTAEMVASLSVLQALYAMAGRYRHSTIPIFTQENIKTMAYTSLESSAMHTMGACWLFDFCSFSLKKEIPDLDLFKISQMLKYHDYVESIVEDVPSIFEKKRAAIEVKEEEAMELLKSIYGNLPIINEIIALYSEFEAYKTPEAKVAKAVDSLHIRATHNIAPIDTWTKMEYIFAYYEGFVAAIKSESRTLYNWYMLFRDQSDNRLREQGIPEELIYKIKQYAALKQRYKLSDRQIALHLDIMLDTKNPIEIINIEKEIMYLESLSKLPVAEPDINLEHEIFQALTELGISDGLQIAGYRPVLAVDNSSRLSNPETTIDMLTVPYLTQL